MPSAAFANICSHVKRQNDTDRREARRLRRTGCSLRRIAAELDLSLYMVRRYVGDSSPEQEVQTGTEENALSSGEQRRCGKCRRDLAVSAFNRHSTRGYQAWCRTCFQAYFRARGQIHREQSSVAKGVRRAAARSYRAAYLRVHPCVDCGESDPTVLEFDHIGPKRADIAVLVADGTVLPRLDEEMAVCDVVCAKCHRRRTGSRARWLRANPRDPSRSQLFQPAERRNLRYVYEVLRDSGCVDCGETDLCVLDFDHVGIKSCSVTRLAVDGCSLARVKDEIGQCEVRCANCHRRKTALGLRELSPS
jgi:predicted transcriptional regulator